MRIAGGVVTVLGAVSAGAIRYARLASIPASVEANDSLSNANADSIAAVALRLEIHMCAERHPEDVYGCILLAARPEDTIP